MAFIFLSIKREEKFSYTWNIFYPSWSILSECFFFSFGARKKKEKQTKKSYVLTHNCIHICIIIPLLTIFALWISRDMSKYTSFPYEKPIWVAQGHQNNILAAPCGTCALEINKEWRFDCQSFHSFPLAHEPDFSCCESKVAEEEHPHSLSPSHCSIATSFTCLVI